MSVHGNLWVGAATVISAAHVATPFTIDGDSASIVRTKHAVARELLETLPVIGVILGEDPEVSVPFHAGGKQDVTYLLQLLVIAASNRDQVTGGSDVLDTRERLRKLFQRPTLLKAQVSEVLLTSIVGKAPLSKAAFLKNYDVSSLAVRVRCVEDAS